MSNTYSSLASIDALLARDYKTTEITQALADLKAMYSDGNISEYQYKNYKTLLEQKL